MFCWPITLQKRAAHDKLIEAFTKCFLTYKHRISLLIHTLLICHCFTVTDTNHMLQFWRSKNVGMDSTPGWWRPLPIPRMASLASRGLRTGHMLKQTILRTTCSLMVQWRQQKTTAGCVCVFVCCLNSFNKTKAAISLCRLASGGLSLFWD